jgi:hypothetical protein
VSRKAVAVTLWIIGIIVVLGGIISFVMTISLRGYVKEAVRKDLRERYDADVEIQDIRVLIFPRVYATATGIVLHHEGRTDIPPLFTADKLTVSAGILSLIKSPHRVDGVELDGLKIRVPPHESNEQKKPSFQLPKHRISVEIGEVTANDASLVMMPKDPGKIPLEFSIHKLVLDGIGLGHPAQFHATLRNPKPVGDIQSEGQFGPWNPEDPAQTPVQGKFSFSHADLATLKGISGILSSQGEYSGVLEKLDVTGDTDTPNFGLQFSGKPVDLKTHYVAVVDGTNGNTYLKSVSAHFLNSTIETNGEVVKVRDSKHRKISIDATVHNGRIEDMLHLVISSDQPEMTGMVNLHTNIDIPAEGPDNVFDRLQLKGGFGIGDAHFSRSTIQEKVDELSRRGQGEPKNEDIEDVISNLQGQYLLKDKVATFSNLAFDVEGAKVQLAGSYNLDSQDLDFAGHLLLKAKLSQLVSGKKSFFLKPFDPIFEKNGAGTSVPIKITGKRTSPSFGLDLGHKDKNDKKNQGKDKNGR